MHVLLVQPHYHTQYPPLGLLKLSSYHKSRGDSTELVRGMASPARKPDVVYVTSLFTYAWKPVHECVAFYKSLFPAAQVILGGIYASLLPNHAARSGADRIHVGIFPEAEDVLPDYSLVPSWNGSIIFASRGCIRNCGFCSVPRLEGRLNSLKSTIRCLVHPKHTRVILWDNNLLSAPNLQLVLSDLKHLGLKVDFNQGLDSRLFTRRVARELAELKTDVIRIAYDYRGMGRNVERAIEYLSEAGVRRRKIVSYVLYNYVDTPDDFFQRIRDLIQWGVVSYPMRFEPLNSLEKNCYVGPKWTAEELEMVADARRVLGTHGAFPPFEGLKIKFERANSFQDAFSLRPPTKKPKTTPVLPKDRPPLGSQLKEVSLLVESGRVGQP